MFSWGCFEIADTKTLQYIQKNVFSRVLMPDWKLLCRYILFWKCSEKKGYSEVSKIPKGLCKYVPFAKQNSILQQKQTPTKCFLRIAWKQFKMKAFCSTTTTTTTTTPTTTTTDPITIYYNYHYHHHLYYHYYLCHCQYY